MVKHAIVENCVIHGCCLCNTVPIFQRTWCVNTPGRLTEVPKERRHFVQHWRQFNKDSLWRLWQYNIPPKTLRRHRDGHVRAPGAVQLGRNVPVLPHQFEEQLVRYIQIMESQMYALTTTDVRHLASELTEWKNLQHPFDRNTHMAGKDWMWSFMAKHSTLTIRVPVGTSLACINGFNRAAADGFFQNYQQILTGGNFDVTSRTVTKLALVTYLNLWKLLRPNMSGRSDQVGSVGRMW